MTTLVLIPGLLCDHRLWESQIAGLGTVAKVQVADIRRSSTISDMAESVLNDAPDRFSLAGFSLGSQMALEIMRIAAKQVERLALLSATRGGLLPATEEAIRQAIDIVEQCGLEHYLNDAYPTYFAEAARPALKRLFVEMGLTVGTAGGLRQMRALLKIRNPFANLDRIHCPTLILGGEQDRRTTPEAHRALASEIPGSELLMIEGAAHFTPIEKPAPVTSALRYWLTQFG